jgi:hypothetical protein
MAGHLFLSYKSDEKAFTLCPRRLMARVSAVKALNKIGTPEAVEAVRRWREENRR